MFYSFPLLADLRSLLHRGGHSFSVINFAEFVVTGSAYLSFAPRLMSSLCGSRRNLLKPNAQPAPSPHPGRAPKIVEAEISTCCLTESVDVEKKQSENRGSEQQHFIHCLQRVEISSVQFMHKYRERSDSCLGDVFFILFILVCVCIPIKLPLSVYWLILFMFWLVIYECVLVSSVVFC